MPFGVGGLWGSLCCTMMPAHMPQTRLEACAGQCAKQEAQRTLVAVHVPQTLREEARLE